MRKYTFAFGAICTIAAASFLGACAKEGECCKDKDKASVKTDAMATPSSTGKCCKDKAAGECPMKAQNKQN